MPAHFQLRPVVAGVHPEAPDHWLVYRKDTADTFELTADAWEIAQAFERPQTAQVVAPALNARLTDIETAVRLLLSLDLLMVVDPEAETPPPETTAPISGPEPPQFRRGPLPEDFTLEIHPDTHFACRGCGTCCERNYLIPVDPERAQRLRTVAAKTGRPDPVALWPQKPGEPWLLTLANDPKCLFLNENRRCDIHDDPAQPDACRVFPLNYAQFEDRIFVSITHRCGCGAGGDGAPLTEQIEDVQARLSHTPFMPQLPDTTRIDQTRTMPTKDVIAHWQECLHGPARTADVLLERLLKGLTGDNVSIDPLPEPLALTRAWAQEAVLSNDPEVRYLFQSGNHIDQDQVFEDLTRTGLHNPNGDAKAEGLRFVRDHLMSFRPYQFATLAEGLFALGLAWAAIRSGGPDHPRARARIMAWEDALPSAPLRWLVGKNGPVSDRTDRIEKVASCLKAWRASP